VFYGAGVIGPFVVAEVFGVGWGVLVGIVMPALWLMTMPCTCMEGGLLASMLGMHQLVALVYWIVRGLILAVSAAVGFLAP